MANLYQLKTEVANTLIAKPETRDDDNLLYYAVCENICTKKNITLATLSFFDVMYSTKIHLPSMASVTRCRRKLQEEDSNLWGKRRQERMLLQNSYIDFSRDE